MSHLVPNDYPPLDSQAPTVFRQMQISNCLYSAFLTLLLYDHVITLEKEIEWIWTLRWRLPKIIFIMNRYIFTLLIIFNCIPEFLFPVSVSVCNSKLRLAFCLPLLIYGCAEYVTIIRVSALYGRRKLVVWSLRCSFVVAFIGVIVLQILFARGQHAYLAYWSLPGCWIESQSDAAHWPVLLVLILVEGVLMLLTAYKLFSYYNGTNKTINVLARDSIIYFLIIIACFVLLLADDVIPAVTFDFHIPAQCVSSMALGRLMMDIRGLVLDDPDHTVHLRTLQFEAKDNSGTETEESVWGQLTVSSL
ncbi:hypothetical protein PILCRDRAFT_825102 [Piloderma croceum F 1598]|uniref:DUF6533 domain-containing protein n=1 Tax=Piloderma croceum (strain F 1598) TaxID=765440 RepID=A0A0C3BK04_PILCF|nr:hypothetical protein PILCRDRAFT_825102 [Piloderma croceum F 1598]